MKAHTVIGAMNANHSDVLFACMSDVTKSLVHKFRKELKASKESVFATFSFTTFGQAQDINIRTAIAEPYQCESQNINDVSCQRCAAVL